MKLSIITINYNNASGLKKTIESVINQSYNNFEYIIIDGNSDDGSKNVIKSYSDKITYWVSEADSGIYNAMNKGIQQATGNYLLFLNSGDTLYNQSVIQDVNSLNFDEDFVYGNMQQVYPNGKTKMEIPPQKINIHTLIYTSIPHPSTFIKRELFYKYGFYREDLKIISDWAFFFNLLVFTKSTHKHIPVTISTFTVDGISSDQQMCDREREQYLDETLSPELRHILEFHQTFYAYDKFYNKKIFVIARKIIDFIKRR